MDQVLTKEEIAKLAPAEREEVGRLEAQRILADEKVIRRARISSNAGIGVGLFTGVVGGLAIFGLHESKVIPFVIILVIMLVGLHVNRLNRRLDAIVHWLERSPRTGPSPTTNDDQET